MSTTLLSRSTRHSDEVTQSTEVTANPKRDFQSNHLALKHFLSSSSQLNRAAAVDAFPHAHQRTSFIAQRSLITRLAALAVRNHPAEGSPGSFSKAMTNMATNVASANVVSSTSSQRCR